LALRDHVLDVSLPWWNWISRSAHTGELPTEIFRRPGGGLNLAFGVLFLFAALFPERRLVQASLVAWLFYAVPHFIFHATQMHHFSPGDNLGQLISLGFLIVLPLVLLFWDLENNRTRTRQLGLSSVRPAEANAARPAPGGRGGGD
jgi:hypothetical protein